VWSGNVVLVLHVEDRKAVAAVTGGIHRPPPTHFESNLSIRCGRHSGKVWAPTLHSNKHCTVAVSFRTRVLLDSIELIGLNKLFLDDAPPGLDLYLATFVNDFHCKASLSLARLIIFFVS